jgi:hypothetical protein
VQSIRTEIGLSTEEARQNYIAIRIDSDTIPVIRTTTSNPPNPRDRSVRVVPRNETVIRATARDRESVKGGSSLKCT